MDQRKKTAWAIKAGREFRGLNRAEMAVELQHKLNEDWGPNRVAKLESGTKLVTVELLAAVKEILGLPFDWFFEGPGIFTGSRALNTYFTQSGHFQRRHPRKVSDLRWYCAMRLQGADPQNHSFGPQPLPLNSLLSDVLGSDTGSAPSTRGLAWRGVRVLWCVLMPLGAMGLPGVERRRSRSQQRVLPVADQFEVIGTNATSVLTNMVDDALPVARGQLLAVGQLPCNAVGIEPCVEPPIAVLEERTLPFPTTLFWPADLGPKSIHDQDANREGVTTGPRPSWVAKIDHPGDGQGIAWVL